MDTEGNSPEQRDRITHVGSYAGLTLFYTYTAAPHCPELGTKERGKTSPHRILCWYFPFSISRSIRRNRSIHHRPEPLLCPSSSTDFASFWHRRNLPSVSGAFVKQRRTTCLLIEAVRIWPAAEFCKLYMFYHFGELGATWDCCYCCLEVIFDVCFDMILLGSWDPWEDHQSIRIAGVCFVHYPCVCLFSTDERLRPTEQLNAKK